MHGTGETVFNRREDVVGDAVLDTRVQRLERGSRNQLDVFAEEFDGSFFAECAALALKGDSGRGRDNHAHDPQISLCAFSSAGISTQTYQGAKQSVKLSMDWK